MWSDCSRGSKRISAIPCLITLITYAAHSLSSSTRRPSGTKRPESVEDGHSYHSVSHRVSFCITINPTSVMATILATWCPGHPAGQRLLPSLISSRSFAASLSAFISGVGWEGTTWEMMTCISHARNPSCLSLPLSFSLSFSLVERAFFWAAVNARVLAFASYTLRPTLCRVAIMDISNMLHLCNTRPRMRCAVSRPERLEHVVSLPKILLLQEVCVFL